MTDCQPARAQAASSWPFSSPPTLVPVSLLLPTALGAETNLPSLDHLLIPLWPSWFQVPEEIQDSQGHTGSQEAEESQGIPAHQAPQAGPPEVKVK